MTCENCHRHYLTDEDKQRGVTCSCPDTFHCPCAGGCTIPGVRCACVPPAETSEPFKPVGRHDFTVPVPGTAVRYCRRCAQPNLAAVANRLCRALPEALVVRRIARKVALMKGMGRSGRGLH